MSRQLSRRRLLRAGGTALAGAVVLGGCGGSSAGTEVSFWAAFPGKPTEKEFRTRFVDAFNAESGEHRVAMSVKQLTTLHKLTGTAVSSGNAPDIVYSPGPSSATAYAAAKKIRSLDAYAAEYDWADALLPWAHRLSQVDGTLYSLPTSYGSMVLYYNPATFEKHGWTPPKTRSDFEELCADAERAGLVPVGAGNSGYKAQTEWYLTAFLNMAAGPEALYAALSGDGGWDDAPVVDAVDTMKRQLDKGWWGGGTERYFTNTDPDMLTGLANGDVAMYLSGTWSFGSMATYFGAKAGNDADWDWAPLPSLSADVDPGVFPLAIGTSLSISAESDRADGAAAFLDFLIASPERSLGYLAATGENPPPVAAGTGAFPKSTDERSVRLYEAVPKSTNLGYTSWTSLPPKSNGYFYEEFDKVITGGLSPKDYCAGLAEAFAAEARDGLVPSVFAPQG